MFPVVIEHTWSCFCCWQQVCTTASTSGWTLQKQQGSGISWLEKLGWTPAEAFLLAG
jgi:hypothetical protein